MSDPRRPRGGTAEAAQVSRTPDLRITIAPLYHLAWAHIEKAWRAPGSTDKRRWRMRQFYLACEEWRHRRVRDVSTSCVKLRWPSTLADAELEIE